MRLVRGVFEMPRTLSLDIIELLLQTHVRLADGVVGYMADNSDLPN